MPRHIPLPAKATQTMFLFVLHIGRYVSYWYAALAQYYQCYLKAAMQATRPFT